MISNKEGGYKWGLAVSANCVHYTSLWYLATYHNKSTNSLQVSPRKIENLICRVLENFLK